MDMEIDDVLFVWLDDSVETSRASQETKKTLSEIVKGNMAAYAEPDKCVDSITDENDKKIFFIVSNKFGQNIVPLIYDYVQIKKIFIYCTIRANAEKWAKQEMKVAGIFTRKAELLDQIRKEMSTCEMNTTVPISLFSAQDNGKIVKQLSCEDVRFVWYQSIIHVLFLIKNHGHPKEEMLVQCRKEYDKNQTVLMKIKEFEENYNANKAMFWYTLDSFAYRLLNQALRKQDMEMIFQFRLFITDLHNQIKEKYIRFLRDRSGERFTFYRGQLMNMSEIDLLRQNQNEIIAMNSFLSATVDKAVAECFTDMNPNEDNPLKSVCFQIDAYEYDEETAPFAFIENEGCIADENEVLFSINAIFRIEGVKEEKNIWIVYLRLEKNYDQLQRSLLDQMLQQIGTEPDPISFGWFLYRSDDLTKAERYAQYLLRQYSDEDKETGNACNLLGLIYKSRNQLKKSIEYFERALNIYSRTEHANSSQAIGLHSSIALACISNDEYQNAKKHCLAIEEILKSPSLANNQLLIQMYYRIQGKLCEYDRDYFNAFEYFRKVYESKAKILSSPHPSLATALNDMGIAQDKMGNYDSALDYFNRTLDMAIRSLGRDHKDLIEYYINIGKTYYNLGKYDDASENFKSASKIVDKSPKDDVQHYAVQISNHIEEINERIRR